MKTNQATPYKVDNNKPKNEYEVIKDGDVKIVQTTVTTSYWKPLEFISLIREHEESIKTTKYNISDEFKEIMKNQLKDLTDEVNTLKPIQKESEELANAAYEEMKINGLTESLKRELSGVKINYDWFRNVWSNVKQEVKEKVSERASVADISKLSEIMLSIKEENEKDVDKEE